MTLHFLHGYIWCTVSVHCQHSKEEHFCSLSIRSPGHHWHDCHLYEGAWKLFASARDSSDQCSDSSGGTKELTQGSGRCLSSAVCFIWHLWRAKTRGNSGRNKKTPVLLAECISSQTALTYWVNSNSTCKNGKKVPDYLINCKWHMWTGSVNSSSWQHRGSKVWFSERENPFNK